jgi:hypothetical protein
MTAISWYLERSGLALVIEVSSDRKQRLGFECHSLNISRQSASKCSPELEAWNAYYGYIAGSFEPKTGQLWIGDSELERWHGYALLVTGMLRYYEATVPHDMVYGMLGLLERQCPPDFELPIRADYEQSSRDLYMSTAFYFIKHTASLAALSLIGDPKEGLTSDLPSWVLDFSSPQRTGALSLLHNEGRPLTTCGVCVGSPESRKLSGATLELEGAYFDEVIEVTSEGWAFDGMPADLRCLEGALHIVGKRTTYSKPPINLLAEVLLCGAENLYAPPGLLKTLGTNDEEDGEASIFRSKDSALFLRGWARKVVVMADSSGVSYKSVLEAMQTLDKQDLLSARPSFSAEVQETINAVKSIGTQPDDQESLRVINTMFFLSDTFIVQAIKNILTKKLYRTSNGCIGFGKSTMEVGDQVWMLCGGRTPFILRPALEDERYTLIGETYLHGFMQGEMITEELKARIQPVYLV